MTKLEFLDRINDILIGLNTAESDALGSLYDELMRDAGWHPASELPPIKKNGKSEWLVSYVECDNDKSIFLRDTVNVYYDSETKTWLDVWGDVQCVEWWSIPPKKEGEL